MHIDELSIFITLTEQLHFGKTSRIHHMTLSALTRVIQRFEKELGVTLFERNNRSVSLTESGQRFLTFARQTVASYDNLQLNLKLQPHQLRGRIKLFATVTASYSILPPLIKSFCSMYPNVTTYLETGAAKYADDLLRRGEIDFAVGILTKTRRSDIVVKKILNTPLVFVVPKHSDYTVLSHCPLIFPEQGDLRSIITDYLDRNHLSIQVHSYAEGHEAILAMVSAGLGGAILPEIVMQHSHLKDTVKQIPVDPSLPGLDVGLFVKKSALNSPVKKAFWDNLI